MSIPTMDAIISYEDFMKMLENQPSLLPRPNCMCLRAWCKYNANILAQILLPNYPQHGWKGMVLQPALFALINNTPFAPPADPGRIAVYPQYALAAAMKMIDAQFTIDMNFYQTYSNIIKRALYNLLTKSVGLLYQASTTPGLSGWDPSISIHDILAQLKSTYGKPDAQTTEANEAMFRMLIQPNQTPESVFLCLEERRMPRGGYPLADIPYTDKQLINQAVMILRKSNIFSTKDFDDWEPKTNKTWASMKAYFQAAYTKCLNNQPQPDCGATGVYQP